MGRLWIFTFAFACGAPPSPPKLPAPVAAPAIAQVCAAPEHRQFDFWIGEWDVAIRARSAPTADTWGKARGSNRIERALGGCTITETFTADGPGTPWSGRSFSMWQAALGKWRQTWVDDQGSYIALSGAVEAGEMTLYGEPRKTPDGATVQMRMVFRDVTPGSLRWEWQRTTDEWKTSIVMMEIVYTRTR